RAMGIRDRPIAPASPWQNGFVERPIGSIRRECVDHIIVLGEAHLRQVLKSYARYYSATRTYLALDKDAPVSRPANPCDEVTCYPGRTSSPLRQSLAFRHTQRYSLRCLSLLLCRFSDAGLAGLSTRSSGRRPKSAKARNRGMWAAAVPRVL